MLGVGGAGRRGCLLDEKNQTVSIQTTDVLFMQDGVKSDCINPDN